MLILKGLSKSKIGVNEIKIFKQVHEAIRYCVRKICVYIIYLELLIVVQFP